MRRHKITPEQRELLHRAREAGVLSLTAADTAADDLDALRERGLLRRAPGAGESARYVLSGEGIAALRD